MKKYLSVIFVIAISCFNVLGQNSLLIKINTSECKSCYAPVHLIDSENSGYKPILVFKGLPEKYVMNFVKENFQNNAGQVIISDSVYNLHSTRWESEVCVVNETGTKLISCNLKNFSDSIDIILKYLPVQIAVKEILKVNELGLFYTSIFRLDDELLIIFDQSIRSVIKLNTRSNEFEQINLEDINEESAFYEQFGDSNFYKNKLKYKDKLNFGGRDKIECYSFFSGLTEDYFYLGFPTIDERYEGKSKFIDISEAQGLFTFKNSVLQKVQMESLPGHYYVSGMNGNCFWRIENDFYFFVRTWDKNEKDIFLAKYQLINDSLKFEKFFDFLMVKKPVFYGVAFINPYVILNLSPVVFNIETSETITLPFDDSELLIDSTTMSFSTKYTHIASYYESESNQLLLIILDESKKLKYVVFDIDTNSVISYRDIQVSNSVFEINSKTVFAFKDKHLLYILSNGTIYEAIVIQ